MKKLLFILALIFAAHVSAAQTTVTATVTDPNGNAYANGTASATSVPGTGQPSVSTTPVATNGSGFFTLLLQSATYIFTVCAPPTNLGPTQNPTPKQVCFSSGPIAISGGAIDLTSSLSSISAVLGPKLGSATGSFTPQVNGATLANPTFLSLDNSGTMFWQNTASGHVQAVIGGNAGFGSINTAIVNDSGVANAYANCPSTPSAAYVAGLQVEFIAGAANTGASTYNYCSNGTAAIVKGGTTPLSANDIQNGQLVALQLTFAGNWQLLNPASAAGLTFQINSGAFAAGSGINFVDSGSLHFSTPSGNQLTGSVQGNISVTSSTESLPSDTGAVNAYAACPGTPNPALTAGLRAHFTAANTSTGSSTFNLCATGAATIVKGGITNVVANDIVSGQTVELTYTSLGNWQILNPSVIGGSGSVSGQVNGQPTIGTGASSIATSPGYIVTSKMTGADLCTRIRTAAALCTTSACHIAIDEGGKQFCNVQPFETAAGNPYAGYVEVWGNGTPLNLWLDGISTIQYGSGLQFSGHGETGSSAGSSGGAANTSLVVCNPALMTCPGGGFQEEQATVNSTTYSANTLTINITGTPFTTCTATGVCQNGGTNQPANCDTGHANSGGGCVNMVAQWRLLCIAFSSVANNNGCRVYKTTSTVSPNQSFVVYSESSLTNCSSSCGTVYLNTPVIADSCDGGCSGGTYENNISDFTIQGMFLPGTEGFVHAGGQELTQASRIQVFNTLADFWHFDQSSAYAGAANGDTNSGPFGPFSGNIHNVQCMKTTCSCVANSGSGGNQCSAGGTIATGGFMFCGGTVTNTGWAQISPDPCVNPNFVGGLYTGGTGAQGPDVVFHQTTSISNLQGSPISDLSGSGDHQSSGFGIFGTQAEMSHTHEEYFATGFAICGDQARNNMWYQAYHAVQTSSVILRGGLNGSNTSLYFDIGDALTTYGNNNLCAGINIEGVFGGTGGSGTLTDNVTKHNMNLSTDAPVSFFLGTGNNPPVRTSQGNGGFSGPVNFPAGICQGGIGQTASALYYLPPYVENTTGSPCTVVSSKAFGIASPHACIAQNLTCSLGTAPAAGDTITCNANNNTTPTTALGCTITSSTPGLKCVDTLKADNFLVSQGDQVLVYYSPSQSSDASAADVHAMFDCF